MMAEDPTGGDVENPDPNPSATAGPSSSTGDGASAKSDPNRKWKVIALSTFLLAAVVLAIALGVTLGGGSSETAPSNAGDIGESDVDSGVVTTTATTATTLPPLTSSSATDPALTEATTQPDDETGTSSNATTTAATTAAAVTVPNEDKDDTTTTDPTEDVDVEPIPVYEQTFLEQNGPIFAQVRIINPGVANGYDKCEDLRVDMEMALAHYANTIIMQEAENDWYEKCDPNNPQPQPYWQMDDDMGIVFMGVAEEAVAEAAPPSDAKGQAGGAVELEDSFETNNQVDGVDEGDIVKSDGNYVYAAYGDVLYVWNATDGTKGISITKMPYEELNKTECKPPTFPGPPIEPFPIDEEVIVFEDESVSVSNKELSEKPQLDEVMTITVQDVERKPAATPEKKSDESVRKRNRRGRHRRHRKNLSIGRPWNQCHKPKPRILSLLLHENRLSVIVSEEKFRPYWYYDENVEESEPIISDHSTLTIRVYDISTVPTDGSALTLLGEKEVKGSYDSSRSVEDTGFIITTSHMNTHLFANDLYRSHPKYCGLNKTEYMSLAKLTVENNTAPFLDRMIEEMDLQLDGKCDSIFQISAMQSGDSEEDSTNGDMLCQFVQVLSFDMSQQNFVNKEIKTDVAGCFSSGWISEVYASQDFAATLSVGSSYDATTGDWKQQTFVLGFDISHKKPKPYCYGEVPGRPINQYATDLYEDHLRIVTQQWNWQNTNRRTLNKIFALELPKSANNKEMEPAGETGHLGKDNESVFAVRFMGPRAYIVTFERTDPFYIYDVADPADMKELGKLEIPGFSSYLHPVTIDGVPMILGVGEEVDEESGVRVGLKISLYNITDAANPTENAKYVDEGAYSTAGHDFKSLRFLTVNQKLIVPKNEYTYTDNDNFDGFVVYDIALGSITESFDIEHASSYDMYHGCWYDAYMPPRSFVFQSKLTTILSHSVISTNLAGGEQLWSLNLDEGLNNTVCSSYFYW